MGQTHYVSFLPPIIGRVVVQQQILHNGLCPFSLNKQFTNAAWSVGYKRCLISGSDYSFLSLTMKCFVALASCLLLLLVVVAAHAYSDCELADGLDVLLKMSITILLLPYHVMVHWTFVLQCSLQYIHDIVVEEVGCCGVYSCGYPDIGQVREGRKKEIVGRYWSV